MSLPVIVACRVVTEWVFWLSISDCAVEVGNISCSPRANNSMESSGGSSDDVSTTIVGPSGLGSSTWLPAGGDSLFDTDGVKAADRVCSCWQGV